MKNSHLHLCLAVLYVAYLIWTVATYSQYDYVMTEFSGQSASVSNVNWWRLLYVSILWSAYTGKIKDESLRSAINSFAIELGIFSLLMFKLTELNYDANELYLTLVFIAVFSTLTYYQHKLKLKNKIELLKSLFKRLWNKLWV